MKVHKVYRSKSGHSFACDLSVGRATEAWEDVTCPDCLAHKAPPVSSPLGYALSSLRRAADAGQSWSVSPTEAAALVAEVERLRAEVSYLRACVPPTRPTDYGHEAWTEALRAAVAEERAAVVAWLRDRRDIYSFADAIEHGEHRASDCPYCGAPSEPGGCADCAAEGYERGEHP